MEGTLCAQIKRVLWSLASPECTLAGLQNKPLISKVILVAVPGLGSSLFQAKIEVLSSFPTLPAPVKLLARSAMVRPCESIHLLHAYVYIAESSLC